MKSALATAAGVAGGMLVAESVRNMLGGGHARDRGPETEETEYIDERDRNGPVQEVDDHDDPGYGGGSDEIDV